MGLQFKSYKTCLITGASKGLGEFLARRFWSSGFNLCLVARSKIELEKIASQLPKKAEQNVVCLACDLSDPVQVSELTSKVKSIWPHIDVMVNNAAIHGPIGPLWENDFLIWQQVIQVNLLVPVALCRAFVPWMIESGGGSIINLSGGGATGPRANFSAYATSKAGLVRFSETLAEETLALGIRVNCIAPGPMKTSMLAEVLEKGAAAAGEREFVIANGVFLDGGESMDRVSALALFLASDASKGITGKLISAVWDNWERWPNHLNELKNSDLYTLRRITGKDRGVHWGDNGD